MPFQSLPPARSFGHAALENCVRIAKGAESPLVSLRISRDLAAGLGEPSHVALRVGCGADAGKLLVSPRVAADEHGYRLHRRSGDAASRLRLTAARIGIAARSFPATTCSHRLTDDGLVVDLHPLLTEQQTARTETHHDP